MKTSYDIISNDRESGKYTLSAKKAIIETNKAARHYYNRPKEIIEKTATTVKTEKIPKLTVK